MATHPEHMDRLVRLIAAHACLRWSTERAQIELVPYDAAHDERATHAYAVPFVSGGQCLATRTQSGRWTLPGGTRNAGETWRETLQRELLEETGCAIDEYQPFASFQVDDGQQRTFRIVCLAAVHRLQEPADPDGLHGIVEVRELRVEQAVRLFDGDLVQYGAVYAIAGALWSAR